VAAFESVVDSAATPESVRIVLHVFCPRAVAAISIETCRDCPACAGFVTGDERESRPAVICRG
jgi:hypothetical protein